MSPAVTAPALTRWPHQLRAVSETLDAFGRNVRCILVTSPTGGGKTVILGDLAAEFLQRGAGVVLYTNRKLLVEQTSQVLDGFGLEHGIRASGHAPRLGQNFQVASLQTELARVLKAKRWELHNADLVLVDEAHLQTGKTARTILDMHRQAGATVVGLTATPLGLRDLYDELIVAGTTSELRACGALVPCLHYGPDEPDLKKIGRVPLGEDLTERQNVKAIMTPTIFARVLEWWKKLNADARPTILFAPGVGESLWFAEQFYAQGITAAHIDGEEVWVNGQLWRSSREARADVLEGSQEGRIKVLCNRFVLREGIDAPWLAHGIFATVFGSLQSYLQSGGRLLRNHPSLASVTLQDHGGNWWRHGSLNADRQWRLDDTAGIVSGLREDRLRAKKEREPFRCPQCAQILAGLRCPCGFEVQPHRKSRPVIQSDGTLREMRGDIYRPHRISQRPDAAQLWERMYYRARNAGMTFRAAEALFAVENNWGYPSRELPLMPLREFDFFLPVADVPRERLR